MSEAQSDNVDEHGLVVHRYRSTVLVVVPSRDFAETALRYARSALFNVHVGTRSVAVEDGDLIVGSLQDEFQPDAKLDGSVRMEDYSGVVFCGGAGARELQDNADALRLAREAAEQQKLVAAWGESVAVLAQAGVLKKRRATGAPGVEALVRQGGGRFTGRQVEQDGTIVTAADDAAGLRFAKRLVQVVNI